MFQVPCNCVISHARKVMLKILYARLSLYVNQELPDVQAGFRKGREARNQIANIRWVMQKAKDSRKASTSASMTTLKPLTVWITITLNGFSIWEFKGEKIVIN